MGVLVKGITQKLYGGQEGRHGERNNKNYIGGKREDRGVAEEEGRYRWEY